MNKVKKFVIIPLVSLAVVIAVAALILSLVRVDPLQKNFGDYSRVALLRSNDGGEFPSIYEEDEPTVDVTDKIIGEGLETVDFSIMHAILEGKFSYEVKLQKDEDKDTTVTAAAIKSYSGQESEYVLRFYYDTPKTIEVEGKSIIYDRLLVKFNDSKGEIKEMDCIPYLEYNIDNQSIQSTYDENGRIGSDYYTTNVLRIKLNTSGLMIRINELLEQYE